MLCLAKLSAQFYSYSFFHTLLIFFYNYRKGGRTIEHSILICASGCAGTPIVYMVVEFQGSKYLYSTQPASWYNTILSFSCRYYLSNLHLWFYFMIVIIDGRIIERGLCEISSFEVSAFCTARLLSSLSRYFFLFTYSFLLFTFFRFYFNNRRENHRTPHIDPGLARGQTNLWCLRSIGILHSPSIIIYLCEWEYPLV